MLLKFFLCDKIVIHCKFKMREDRKEVYMGKKGDVIVVEPTVNRKEKMEKRNKVIILVVIAIIVTVAAVLIYRYVNRTFNDYEVKSSKERNDSKSMHYQSYNGDKMLKYSNDGITVMDGEGKAVWSAGYNMKNPYVVTRGEYVAIADIGNKQLVIYDGKGNGKEVEILNPIAMVDISAQGIATVVLEDEMVNYIRICDGSNIYAEIKTRIAVDGYPLSVSISDDARKLVTSYVAVGENEGENYLTFYNFGEVGKSYNNKIVRAETLEDEMVPMVRFVNNDEIVAFTDRRIKTYKMKETPEELYVSDKFEYNIRSVVYSEERVGVVLDNYKEGKKQLLVYTLSGDEEINLSLENEYKDIYASGKEVIMTTDVGVRIIGRSGKVKFEKKLEERLDYFFPYNNKDKYILIDENSIELIKLIESK